MSGVWTADSPLVTASSNFTASGSSPLAPFPNVPNWPGVPQLPNIGACWLGSALRAQA